MTDSQRAAAIKKLIQEHTEAITADRKTAREALIAEGIYTEDGALAVQFGGEPQKNQAAI